MMPVNTLNPEAAEKARQSAGKLSHKRKTNQKEAYVKRDHSYDQRIQRCKCGPKAWNSKEGFCIRCGKWLPGALPGAL